MVNNHLSILYWEQITRAVNLPPSSNVTFNFSCDLIKPNLKLLAHKQKKNEKWSKYRRQKGYKSMLGIEELWDNSYM